MRAGRWGFLASCTFLSLILCASCMPSGPVPAASEVRRPKYKKPALVNKRMDCKPIRLADEPLAVIFANRDVMESTALTNDAMDRLKSAGEPKSDRAERRYSEAVEKLIEALDADPYNVVATYELAATFARIGRARCATQLLGRITSLAKLGAKKKLARRYLDHLLGRGVAKDARFNGVRETSEFREFLADLMD